MFPAGSRQFPFTRQIREKGAILCFYIEAGRNMLSNVAQMQYLSFEFADPFPYLQSVLLPLLFCSFLSLMRHIYREIMSQP